MAKSCKLKEAISLQNRPYLHCTTIPLLLLPSLLIIAQKYQMIYIHTLSWILFAAFISHHTRDASRRGYWIYPFGSTPPIPYILYIVVTVCLPYIIVELMKYTSISKKYELLIDLNNEDANG